MAGWLAGWLAVRPADELKVSVWIFKNHCSFECYTFRFVLNRNNVILIERTYAFKAGFPENYFLKVVTRERIFVGSHMKPGQSLL